MSYEDSKKISFPLLIPPTDLDVMYEYRQKIGTYYRQNEF